MISKPIVKFKRVYYLFIFSFFNYNILKLDFWKEKPIKTRLVVWQSSQFQSINFFFLNDTWNNPIIIKWFIKRTKKINISGWCYMLKIAYHSLTVTSKISRNLSLLKKKQLSVLSSHSLTICVARKRTRRRRFISQRHDLTRR